MNFITDQRYVDNSWKKLTTIKMAPTIESDETESIFKVIAEAELDSWIICSYIYIYIYIIV